MTDENDKIMPPYDTSVMEAFSRWAKVLCDCGHERVCHTDNMAACTYPYGRMTRKTPDCGCAAFSETDCV